MSEKIWSDEAWEDYLYWQLQDKKTLKRINQLIKDIERNGCLEGIGNPEALRGDLQGELSRRIDEKIAWSIILKMAVFLSHRAAATMTTNKDIPANIKAPRRPSQKALRGALRLLLDLGGRNPYSTMMLLPLISAGTGRPI